MFYSVTSFIHSFIHLNLLPYTTTQHLAYEYASRGAYLALVARREKGLREVVDLALEMGSPQVIMIIADVQKVEDCRRIVTQTINHFGRCKLLHLNSTEDILTLILNYEQDTNFWGSAYITRFAIPHLRETAGKIIAIASAASWLPEPMTSIYNVQVGLTPVVSVVSTARAIVKSACRGDKYLTVPAWVRTTWIWKVLCPDAVELAFRLFFTGGGTKIGAPTKTMLDITGAQRMMYPDSIQNPGIKTE
ncbi:11-beta-hydroxysteroid dehydrogenase A [Linum perenne]